MMIDVARLAGEWITLVASDGSKDQETVTIADLGDEGISVQNCGHLCTQFFVAEGKDGCFKKCPKREDIAECRCLPPSTFVFEVLEVDYERFLLVHTEVEVADSQTHHVIRILGRNADVGKDTQLMEHLKSVAQEKTGIAFESQKTDKSTESKSFFSKWFN